MLRYLPVIQQLNKPGHRSSSRRNSYVHLSNRLQIPDHTATPTTCTEHQDYPDLLNLLSRRTCRQPNLCLFRPHRLTIPLRLHWHYIIAAILHKRKLFVNEIKVRCFYLIILPLLSLPSLLSVTSFIKRLRDWHIYRCRNMSIPDLSCIYELGKRNSEQLCQRQLEANQKESDTWLKHTERTWERERERERAKKSNSVCFCQWEEMKDKLCFGRDILTTVTTTKLTTGEETNLTAFLIVDMSNNANN